MESHGLAKGGGGATGGAALRKRSALQGALEESTLSANNWRRRELEHSSPSQEVASDPAELRNLPVR
jgi:hypothetical protein